MESHDRVQRLGGLKLYHPPCSNVLLICIVANFLDICHVQAEGVP
jgi:hypothetical protein